MRGSNFVVSVRNRLIVVDILTVVVACSFGALGASRFGWEISLPFLGRGAMIVTPVLAVLWILALFTQGAWDVRYVLAGIDYYARVLSATATAFISVSLMGFVGSVDAARPFALFALPIGAPLMVCSRWLVRLWSRKNSPKIRTLIVGKSSEWTRNILGSDLALRMDVVDCIEGTSVSQVCDLTAIKNIERLVLNVSHGLTPEELRAVLWKMNESGVDVWFDTATHFIRSGRGVMIPSTFTTFMMFEPVHLNGGERVVKRLVDLSVSTLCFVLLLPVTITAILAILIKDGRPVFFTQERIGLNGQKFFILKLRTMVDGAADLESYNVGKLPDDPRVTSVGKVLRRWSIDEIPQFLNVIKGEMSIVGPRPRLATEVRDTHLSARRLQAKPGITGPWQISGRFLIDIEEADALDVNYVDSWSLFTDVVIILRTIRVIFSGEGAF